MVAACAAHHPARCTHCGRAPLLLTMQGAIDRGGPFGRTWRTALAGIRDAIRGKASATPPAESSPIGGAQRLRSRDEGAGSWAVLRPVSHWLAAIALACAVAAFARAGYIVAKADLGQWLLQRAWREARATGRAVKPWPWADTHPVARLTAPAQDADVIVLAGATGRTLAWGPAQLDGSARAGDIGNAVFTAHRDTHFAFLARTRIGDPLVVERVDGTRARFRVAATAIVDKDALVLRRDAQRPTLTLVTCYPFDAIAPGARLRYVVTASAAADVGAAGRASVVVSALGQHHGHRRHGHAKVVAADRRRIRRARAALRRQVAASAVSRRLVVAALGDVVVRCTGGTKRRE
jgi:sortase A